MENNATTVELTSKKWKSMKLISFLMMFILAPIFYGNESQFWIPMFMFGITLYFISKIGAWWYHG